MLMSYAGGKGAPYLSHPKHIVSDEWMNMNLALNGWHLLSIQAARLIFYVAYCYIIISFFIYS